MSEFFNLLDDTHDPTLQSWIETAQDPETDFPIQNLPYGRFRRLNSHEPWRIGVAIGDQVLDLAQAIKRGQWSGRIAEFLGPLAVGNLAALMTRPSSERREVRAALSNALRSDIGQQRQLEKCLVPLSEVELTTPCRIGDYTDFYTGIHHGTTVGKLFRPDSPLLPNYKWVPIGYHGRSSSIVVSGTEIRRPHGQRKLASEIPEYGPTEKLDFELELGYFIGPGNDLGKPIPINRANEHLFGVVLLNDWSARDVQAWEYQPLGPFLSKNFATTISPWVVTAEALAPFRSHLHRSNYDQAVLAYLDDEHDRAYGAINIQLEVWLQTKARHASSNDPRRLATTNARTAAFWTPGQLIAHHTSGGCNLQTGDLLGSGTLSGSEIRESGSLLELTKGGRIAVELGNGQSRTFLEDGDSVIFKARCSRQGARSIGFGLCEGKIIQ